MRAGGFLPGVWGGGVGTGRGMLAEQRVGARAEGCCGPLGGRALPPGCADRSTSGQRPTHRLPCPAPLLCPPPALDKLVGMEDDFVVTSAFPSSW